MDHSSQRIKKNYNIKVSPKKLSSIVVFNIDKKSLNSGSRPFIWKSIATVWPHLTSSCLSWHEPGPDTHIENILSHFKPLSLTFLTITTKDFCSYPILTESNKCVFTINSQSLISPKRVRRLKNKPCQFISILFFLIKKRSLEKANLKCETWATFSQLNKKNVGHHHLYSQKHDGCFCSAS